MGNVSFEISLGLIFLLAYIDYTLSFGVEMEK